MHPSSVLDHEFMDTHDITEFEYQDKGETITIHVEADHDECNDVRPSGIIHGAIKDNFDVTSFNYTNDEDTVVLHVKAQRDDS